jgi:hypothetical protein
MTPANGHANDSANIPTTAVHSRLAITTKGGSPRGQVMPYADQRAYTDRLNTLVTPAGWIRRYTIHTSANFERSKDQKIVAKVLVTCELTIFGLGSHSATGEEWADDDNAATAAEAQFFKRACSCFGLGRYLEIRFVEAQPQKVVGVIGTGRDKSRGNPCRFSRALVGSVSSTTALLRAQVRAFAKVFRELRRCAPGSHYKDARRQVVPRQVPASLARAPPEPGSALWTDEPLGKELDPLHPDRPASWIPASHNGVLLTSRPTEYG